MYDGRIQYYEVTVSFAEIAAATSAEQSVTVSGVAPPDIVLAVNKPTAFDVGTGISHSRVSAVDTIKVNWYNAKAAGAVTPTASEKYVFAVMKRQP